MKKIAFIIFLAMTLSSCSNLSKNTVKEGSFVVRNGTAGDKIWKDNLNLKRVSWYHEMTLEFDLMLANVDPQSGFNFWFSQDELQEIGKCGDFKIAIAYSFDTKIIPYSYLNEQLDVAGYKKIDLIGFKKHFLRHPDAEINSLRLYQVFGICHTDQGGKSLILSFPGFTEKTLN